jgi:hypothetical protein
LGKIRPAIQALTNHHVPDHFVLSLIKDPACMVPGCTVNLMDWDYHRPGLNGKRRLALHVDHDHKCPICKGAPNSCGTCVRGLVCWRHNLVFGMAGDDPVLLDGGARYLRAWQANPGWGAD